METFAIKNWDLNSNLKFDMFVIQQKIMADQKQTDIEEIIISIQPNKIAHLNLYIKQNMLVQDAKLSR